MSKTRSIALMSYRAFGIASSRLELISALRDRGYDVVAFGEEDPSRHHIEEAGAKFVGVGFHRGKPSANDLKSLIRLASVLRRVNPALVVQFNLKPLLLGTVASEVIPGAKRIGVVTGFGASLEASRVVRGSMRVGLRYAARRSDRIVFQNSDDLEFAVNERLVPVGKARLILSSGVRTDEFAPGSSPRAGKEVRVLLVSRLLWQKGVGRFVEAARRLRDEHPNVRFILAGELDSGHPDAVPESEIERWQAEELVEYWGYIEDMPDILREVDVFVLPTTYREGVPRVVLEASSTGLPVITMDGPGCREVVQDGVTGLLLRDDSSESLSGAIMEMAESLERRVEMGRAGRRLMRERFDRRFIIDQMISLFEEVGGIASNNGVPG